MHMEVAAVSDTGYIILWATLYPLLGCLLLSIALGPLLGIGITCLVMAHKPIEKF